MMSSMCSIRRQSIPRRRPRPSGVPYSDAPCEDAAFGADSRPGSRTPAPREAARPTDPATRARAAAAGVRHRSARKRMRLARPPDPRRRLPASAASTAGSAGRRSDSRRVDVDRHQSPTSGRMRAVEARFPESARSAGVSCSRAPVPAHRPHRRTAPKRRGRTQPLSATACSAPGIVAQVAQGGR